MIKSIVYTSNSGFTKKYAEMLGEELKIPVYDFKSLSGKVAKTDEIIYMGWIMAGGIQNYKKAKKMFNIKAVCAVGMSVSDGKQDKELVKKYDMKERLFYLQGGFDKTKLKGIYRFMMNSLEKAIKPKLEAKIDKTADEIEMLEMMNHGKDCVKKENLEEIICWAKEK